MRVQRDQRPARLRQRVPAQRPGCAMPGASRAMSCPDCDSIADIERGHHYTKTVAEAAAISLKLGVDNDCAEYGRAAGATSDYDRYVDAMKQGLVSQAVVDDSLRRLFTARMRLGLFDPPAAVPYNRHPPTTRSTRPSTARCATKLAREAMVLLKNNGMLPVKPAVKKIAVVGPLADQVDVLNGNYNGTPVAAGQRAGGHSQGVPECRGGVRARHRFPARGRAGADRRAVHAGRRAGAEGRILARGRFRRCAGGEPDRCDHRL